MSRAQATLKQLRLRVGFVEPKEERPPVVVIRAPSQTEWWTRVQGSLYELNRTVAEASAVTFAALEKP